MVGTRKLKVITTTSGEELQRERRERADEAQKIDLQYQDQIRQENHEEGRASRKRKIETVHGCHSLLRVEALHSPCACQLGHL